MEEVAGLYKLYFSCNNDNKSIYTQMQKKVMTNLHPNIIKFEKIVKYRKKRVKFGDFVELI
jgi:predicted HAD superfamily hydrolase